MSRLPKLPMVVACNHYRYHGAYPPAGLTVPYGCAVLGECKPIQASPDLSACPQFQANGKAPTKPVVIPKAGSVAKRAIAAKPPCKHLGGETGRQVECSTCTGKVELPLLACAIHGACTQSKIADVKHGKVACCRVCDQYEAR